MSKKKHVIGAAAYTDLMGQARFSAEKGPDALDLNNISSELFDTTSRMHELAKERTADERRDESRSYLRAAAGGVNRGLMGMHGHAGQSAGMTAARPGCDARSAFTSNNLNYGTHVSSFRTLDGCKFRTPMCDADLLGFVTVEDQGGTPANTQFPLAAAAGVTTVATVQADSGTSGQYQPAYYYWEFRDANNGFIPVPGLLTNVSIGSEQQLVGNVVRNGVVSSVFALTSTPLQVGWAPWTSIPNLGIELTFGNFLQNPAISVHAFNLWWGNSQKLGGRGGTAPVHSSDIAVTGQFPGMPVG